ncbi:hypothetical protein C0583_04780 [Candidatus Parcubacteria bacterium]|nr:MAG: hypothetical protein C0583_04780 [Candidatus Parcubacteria bacterium]
MKNKLFLIFIFFAVQTVQVYASELTGRILLQVEENGEAWYVAPNGNERHYLGNPDDAFEIMREMGVGISNNDLAKISVALDHSVGMDSDSDGVIDEIEKAIGTDIYLKDTDEDGYSDKQEIENSADPISKGQSKIDINFSKQQAGKIFLQVESKGEAWYVAPDDYHRYYLGRPLDAFNLMRNLGLGISNEDLENILAKTPNFNTGKFEQIVHNLINKEREKEGLNDLAWNENIASVAREHSQNLAQENKAFTQIEALCSYPMIHHEGFNFGDYQSDRLNNRGIYYYNMTGENIALLSMASVRLNYVEGTISENAFLNCSNKQEEWSSSFKLELEEVDGIDEKKSIIRAEIEKRKNDFATIPFLGLEMIRWDSEEELAEESVEGWMNSPGHRQNILTAEYDEAGVGAEYVEGYIIVTQVFIRRTDCGYKNSECCYEDTNYYCYKPYSCTNGYCL